MSGFEACQDDGYGGVQNRVWRPGKLWTSLPPETSQLLSHELRATAGTKHSGPIDSLPTPTIREGGGRTVGCEGSPDENSYSLSASIGSLVRQMIDHGYSPQQI